MVKDKSSNSRIFDKDGFRKVSWNTFPWRIWRAKFFLHNLFTSEQRVFAWRMKAKPRWVSQWNDWESVRRPVVRTSLTSWSGMSSWCKPKHWIPSYLFTQMCNRRYKVVSRTNRFCWCHRASIPSDGSCPEGELNKTKQTQRPPFGR